MNTLDEDGNKMVTGAMVTAAQAVLLQPKRSEEELDEAVARVREYQRDTLLGGWRLGKELDSIHGKLLWKLRRNPEGGVAYKTWKEFCAVELRMAKQTALRMVYISRSFSEEEAKRLGSEKMTMLFTATKKGMLSSEQTEELKAEAVAKTTKELKERLHEMGVRTPTPKSAAKKVPKTDEDAITIATLLGKKHKLVLLEREKKGDEFPPAKNADRSWAYLDLKNDVRLIFGIFKSGKKWTLHVEPRRIED